MQSLRYRYPSWDQGEDMGKYHMNRAALGMKWDQMNQMLDFYTYQYKDESAGARMKEYALILYHIHGNEMGPKNINNSYGLKDVMNTIPGLYYSYVLNVGTDEERKKSLRYVLFNSSPESLIGYIHPKMKADALSSLWWYNLETSRPIVAYVVHGNYDPIPYSFYINIHQKNGAYPQVLASAIASQKDAPGIFSLLSKADAVTMDMVYGVETLANKFNLRLTTGSNPCIVELLPSYVGNIVPSPVIDLAISLSGSVHKQEEEESEFVVL